VSGHIESGVGCIGRSLGGSCRMHLRIAGGKQVVGGCHTVAEQDTRCRRRVVHMAAALDYMTGCRIGHVADSDSRAPGIVASHKLAAEHHHYGHSMAVGRSPLDSRMDLRDLAIGMDRWREVRCIDATDLAYGYLGGYIADHPVGTGRYYSSRAKTC